MRRTLAVSIGLLVCLLASTAVAGEMKPAVYVGGGVNMPMGDWSDFWKMGFGGSGRLAFEVAPAIEIGATFGYTAFPFDDDKFIEWVEANWGDVAEDAEVEGLDVNAMEFLADIKYKFGVGPEAKAFAPYMMAVFGMTQLSFDDATVTEGGETQTIDMSALSATDLTLGFGAGFEYMFSPKAGLWVDGKYMVIMTEGESTSHLPIRAGLKFMFGGN